MNAARFGLPIGREAFDQRRRRSVSSGCAEREGADIRGSKRVSSKMSGRLPRLRALRPRPQQPREQKDQSELAESQEEAGMKGYEEDELETEGKQPNERDEEPCDGVKEDTLADNGKGSLRTELDDVEFAELPEQRQSYECDTCVPTRSLPNLKAYLDHLKKEHKQKVHNDRSLNTFPTNRFATPHNDTLLVTLLLHDLHHLASFSRFFSSFLLPRIVHDQSLLQPWYCFARSTSK